MSTKPVSTVAKAPVSVTSQKVASSKANMKTAKTAVKPAPKTTKPLAKPAVAGKSVAKPLKQAKPRPEPKTKVKKPKLVRDSFTIPKPEYLVLDALKARANHLASPAKKGELLRAGIKALAAMSDAALLVALKAVPAIKTGRPVKV
jgi:hypothetical protein